MSLPGSVTVRKDGNDTPSDSFIVYHFDGEFLYKFGMGVELGFTRRWLVPGGLQRVSFNEYDLDGLESTFIFFYDGTNFYWLTSGLYGCSVKVKYAKVAGADDQGFFLCWRKEIDNNTVWFNGSLADFDSEISS